VLLFNTSRELVADTDGVSHSADQRGDSPPTEAARLILRQGSRAARRRRSL
jgi:hypothetical protein